MHTIKTCALAAVAVWLGWAAVPSLAETVDFESAAYITDQGVDGQDGWLRASIAGGSGSNFVVKAEPGDKFLRGNGNEIGTVYRPFPKQSGTLDLHWRVRALTDSAHLCFGPAGILGDARASAKALGCLVTGGKIEGIGLSVTPDIGADSWSKNVWYYLRLHMDFTLNQFSLYFATDSLGADERLETGPSQMANANQNAITRVVVETEKASGPADIDDIVWEPVATWSPSALDTSWTNPANWSTNAVPDAQTHVAFPAASTFGCLLTRNAAARSITVAKGYAGTLDFDTSSLTLIGNADLTGLRKTAGSTGALVFASTRGQSLAAPQAVYLPHVAHPQIATGTLRLDAAALFSKGLTQSGGVLDLNGEDLFIDGLFTVRNGGPASLANLGGRNITVTKKARLEGSQGSLLGLSPAAPWHISATDSLNAAWADIGNSTAGQTKGVALSSNNGGGDSNWIFALTPGFALQPRDTVVLDGGTATFKVSATGNPAPHLQWYRNDALLPGATGSTLVVGATRADSGAVYSCQASSYAGIAISDPARLGVLFPAPGVAPKPQAFPDSLSIKVTSSVANATLLISLNGGPWQVSNGALLLTDSTTLSAKAALGADTSAVATWSFPKTQVPQAKAPVFTPDGQSFPDVITVTMSDSTPGSRIYYTMDASQPDSTKTRYTGPVTLKATTTLRAVAAAAGYRNSEVTTRIYARQSPDTLALPTAVPPGGGFGDSVQVHLSAPGAPGASIFYSIDAGAGAPNLLPYDSAAGVVIRETSVLRAIAILNDQYSDTAKWIFTKRLAAPGIFPKGANFSDTLTVSLAADTGAEIYYSLDGSVPDSAYSHHYIHPILLDSTAILNAIAYKPGLIPSAVQTESYRLVPLAPSAFPKGGDFLTPIHVHLTASSPKARIYFTLDGSAPGAGNGAPYVDSIPLDSNAVLRAVAVTGQGVDLIKGPEFTGNYTFFSAVKRSLGPGQTLQLSSNYSLASPLTGGDAITVETLPPDSLKPAHGFRDVQFGIRAGLDSGAKAFPLIYLNEPGGEERALYEIDPAGAVTYVTDADTARLPGPGTYFLGVDTLPPQIILSQENFVGDSSRLVFTIQDNVANLALDVRRSDDTTRDLSGQGIVGPDILTLMLKAKGGALAPLTLAMRVSDHRNASNFPSDTSAPYSVAQKLGPVRSPAGIQIGADPDNPWDLFSIPLEADHPVTIAQLRGSNNAKNLEASVWNSATNGYPRLKDDDAVLPGQSVWLGLSYSLPSLALPALQTLPRRGSNSYQVTLHPGWNQVSNPSLGVLYWPVTPRITQVLDNSSVKDLQAYVPATGGYVGSDSLLPWKGYFVFFRAPGKSDTTVTLLNRPPALPGGKRAALAGFSLRLEAGQYMHVRLGASPFSDDGVGVEDQPQPPARTGKIPSLWSLRESQRLGTDLLRWRPGALYRWRIVAGLPVPKPGIQGNTQVTPGGAAVAGLSLPPGYSAWAASPARGLKFALGEGAVIPMFPGFTDTLDVYVGPSAEVEARLAAVPSAVGSFHLSVSPSPAGFTLRLNLPRPSRVRWSLWTPTGRALAGGSLSLPQGIYRLPLGGAGSAPGLYLFRAEWTGADGRRGDAGVMACKLMQP